MKDMRIAVQTNSGSKNGREKSSGFPGNWMRPRSCRRASSVPEIGDPKMRSAPWSKQHMESLPQGCYQKRIAGISVHKYNGRFKNDLYICNNVPKGHLLVCRSNGIASIREALIKFGIGQRVLPYDLELPPHPLRAFSKRSKKSS